MSTLTKVLIVLLSLSSIFLSGTMVTFVATTANFKEIAETQKIQIQSLEDETATSDQRFMEKSSQMEELRKKLMSDVQVLQGQIGDLAMAKRSAETERDELKAEVSSWTGVVTGFEGTIANKTETLKLTQAELTKAQAALINLNGDLNTSEAGYAEKIIQIDRLTAQVKNLIETKSIYERQIAQLSSGRKIATEKPVTRVYDYANAASTAASTTTLRGLVTQVSQKLIAISLGSADGVSNRTVFHVTRGDEFICNIKITNVDINESAGVIELPMEQPKVGDTVSNRL